MNAMLREIKLLGCRCEAAVDSGRKAHGLSMASSSFQSSSAVDRISRYPFVRQGLSLSEWA